MIQFTVNEKSHDAPRQVKDALEAGITWIEVPESIPNQDKEEIENLCKETGAFLLICDDIDFVNAKRWHGIHMDSSALARAAQTRLQLGAHAIIGVDIKSLEQTNELALADIDFAVMDIDRANLDEMLEMDKSEGKIPLVARVKGLSAEECANLIDSGFNGINIAWTWDKSVSIGKFIESLNTALNKG